MNDRRTPPEGLATLDAMIARAEALCERCRAVLDRHPAYERRYLLQRRARLQTMEDTLARLRAQREAAA